MSRGAPWTDEERERVARLLLSGRTMSSLSKMLGLTRNAVIGRISRDGELHAYVGRVVIDGRLLRDKPPRRPVIPELKRHVHREKRYQCLAVLPPIDPEPAPARRHGDRSIVAVGRNECRWPVGWSDTVVGKFLFCCRPRWHDDTAYCRFHHVMGHQ